MPRKPARRVQPQPTPKGTSRVTADDRRRQHAILLDRGAMTAAAYARRHGVSHWTVRAIWRGLRWTPDLAREDALVMVQRDKGAWAPAGRNDERALDRIIPAGQPSGGLAQLVALAAEHGVAVVFRGDLGR